jgi:hypothetical protein
VSAPSKRSTIAIASGPQTSEQPKPALDEVLPEAALRAKIADYLRQSRARTLAGAGDHG